mgnify:CR=1 FL=1
MSLKNNQDLELDPIEKQRIINERKRKRKNVIVYSFVYLFLSFLVLIAVIPFWIVLINATRDGMSISTQGITIFPGSSLKENYKILVSNVDVLRGFWNSLKIAVLVTILSGYFSALTAYGFHMFKFRGKNVLFGVILVFMMIPSQLAFLGYVKLIRPGQSIAVPQWRP